MGQYYRIVNIDKKEFLHPHKFGDGLKIWEFGFADYGTMAGLTFLLASGHGSGINETESSELIGSWAGDRIVILGDYSEEFPEVSEEMYSDEKEDTYKDISNQIIEVLKQDEDFNEHFLSKNTFGLRH